jgi:hypothetical protein
MEVIKKYKVVIISVILLLVLILIRSSGFSHFKNDTQKRVQPSLNKSNLITLREAGRLAGKSLIINLSGVTPDQIKELSASVQNIPADSVLSKNHIKGIMKHEGPILLYSSEPGLSARIWMIISQLGCRNLYILTDSTDNDILKYKFRPVTDLNRPE